MSVLFDDALSQYLSGGVPNIVDYPFTFSAWINVDSLAGLAFAGIVYMGSTADPYRGHRTIVTNSNDKVRARSQDNSATFFASDSVGTITINTWRHVCGVFASRTSRLVYLNGIAGSASADDVAFGTYHDLKIGATTEDVTFLPTHFMSGKIAEVGIWNSALSAADVAYLANGYKPTQVSRESLLNYYPLRSDILDYAGNPPLALTANNGPTFSDHVTVQNIAGVTGNWTAGTTEKIFKLEPGRTYELYNLSATIPVYASLDGAAVEATTAEKAGKLVLDVTAASAGRPVVIQGADELRIKTASGSAALRIQVASFEKAA